MKILIAYALVIIGLPFFLGNIIGTILSAPISFIIGISRGGRESPIEVAKAKVEAYKWTYKGKVKMDMRDRIAHICYDIFAGLGTMFTAGLIFYLLGLSPGILIVVIVVAWEIIIAKKNKESFRMLFGNIMGVALGYFMIMWLFVF